MASPEARGHTIPGKNFFLSAFGATTISAAVLFAGHVDYDANVAPAKARAEEDASRIVPPVAPDYLTRARQIRIDYYKATQVLNPSPYNSNEYHSRSFDPEEVARLSTQPEVLNASSVLNQDRKYKDQVAELLRQKGTEARNNIDIYGLQIGGGVGVSMGMYMFLVGGLIRLLHGGRQSTNGSSPQTQHSIS